MSENTEEAAGNGVADDTEEQQPKGASTRDPELVAMIKISKLLNALSDADRGTVVRFLNEKYVEDLS